MLVLVIALATVSILVGSFNNPLSLALMFFAGSLYGTWVIQSRWFPKFLDPKR